MDTINEMLKCKYPIIQGAMGVICNPELVAAVSEAGGFGLLGIRERMQLLGGRMEIGTGPGQGFRLTASVPLTHAAEPLQSEQ